MPDILKVTTPVINKNQNIQQKSGVDPLSPFNINDPSRVVRVHNNTEILKHNTGKNENGDGPVMLMSLLKDPAAAVSYLKNIFLLEEIFKLLPANNQTVTQEIEQIFQSLLMKPEDVKKELVRQETASTMFKGPIFDFLREILGSEKTTPSLQHTIATFLKSINNLSGKDDILDAVANSLTYLRENMASSKPIYEALDDLIAKFRGQDANENFGILKEQTLGLIKDIEQSILFTPKLSKVLSILIYNLSRYNNNMGFFNQSAFRLKQMLPSETQSEFVRLVDHFSKQLADGTFPYKDRLEANSQVMNALIDLVLKESENENITLNEAAKIDKILHSLLSSPCNFTPLLHFIVPVVFENLKAFAEIWINPQSDEKDMPGDATEGRHFLLVIDIDTIGRFEAEVFSHDNIIDFFLYCPSGYEESFRPMMDNMARVLSKLNYRLGQTRLEQLKEPRSLMQVFKSLPYKRVGVDVKI